MGRFVIRRMILLIPMILGVSFLVFVFMDLAPGTVLDSLANDLSEAELARLYHEYGYDRSVIYRYLLYLRGMFTGSLGYSYIYKTDVLTLYFSRFPATLALAFSSLLLAVVLSIPLGVLAAANRGKAADGLISGLSVLGMSMPNFWLGVLLMLLFSQSLHLLPSGGNAQGIRSLILPAFTLGCGLMAALTRTTRSGLLDVLQEEYLKTARAKGLTKTRLLMKHALKNALVPVFTVLGSQMGMLVGGSVVTENVFAWPGVGRLLVDAIKERDTTTVTGCLILTALFIGLIQLLVDVGYAAVNPRLRERMLAGGQERRESHG